MVCGLSRTQQQKSILKGMMLYLNNINGLILNSGFCSLVSFCCVFSKQNNNDWRYWGIYYRGKLSFIGILCGDVIHHP